MSIKVHTLSTTFATLDIAAKAATLTFYSDLTTAEDQADKRDHLLVASQEDMEGLSSAQLVDIYNFISAVLGPDYAPVKRFSDKSAATTRTWIRFQDLANKSQKFKPEAVKADKARDKANPTKATDYPATTKAPRRNTGINLAPKANVYACKEGTKQALFVDLLSRPEGATMEELMVAMSTGKPWQEVTVKSGLNWDMNKVKGYGIRTTKRGDVDCYHLVLPAGMDAPLPHTPRKAKA